MAKNNNLVKIVYSKEDDQYELWTSIDNGKSWDFAQGGRCVLSERDKPDDEPQYIFHGIIEKLNEYVDYGYKYVVR